MGNKKSICLIKIKVSKAVKLVLAACFFIQGYSSAQLKWVNVDSLFQPLPKGFHVYKTTDSLDGKPNIAFYVIADLRDRKLNFTTDTTYQRRLTLQQFYKKNNLPLLVVNGTFFDFANNRNLNAVIKDGKLVSYNIHTIPLKGNDTMMYLHPFRSAIGINKKRKADVAWLYTDSAKTIPFASQNTFNKKDSFSIIPKDFETLMISNRLHTMRKKDFEKVFYKWKVITAIGGGPVLLQNGKIMITNNEEIMFAGKAIDDKHPRTAMGYTRDNKLIILVVQGRFPGIAEGASLKQEAQILKDLGCWEALNLDGGGSSCMLINGKETIKPSDKEGQRAVPAVFTITNINIP
jgi:exopolysaccharide biosynthesis protein